MNSKCALLHSCCSDNEKYEYFEIYSQLHFWIEWSQSYYTWDCVYS